MECIEARALKSSFLLSQMVDSQAFQNDDVWATVNSVAPDDFPVEELLNLDFPEKELDLSQEDEAPNKESSNYSSSAFSGADEIDSLSQLAVPVDDLDNLEWLSQFVDDSTSGLTLSWPTISNNREPPKIHPTRFHVPVKPRSNRSRKSTGRSWSPFVFANPVRGEKPVTKRQKRKPESETGLTRKCTHCQVQKTPQWRTGPLGPKTLCNACGVRFKSGRLFPEYRPAFSPSFSLELHSNSHRKVLEMRRKKDAAPAAETGFMAVRDLVMAGSVEPVSV